MYRVNSISKQLVRLNVIEAGKPQLVELLPKNFVFTEVVTDQMRLLEKEGVIRVRAAKVVKAGTQSTEKPVSKATQATAMEGKLDMVGSGIAKVQKKKK